MLHNVCSDACYSLAEYLVKHSNSTWNYSITKKFFDALFYLQEVEIMADDVLYNKRKIHSKSNYCLVNKLLYPCDASESSEADDLISYKEFLLNSFDIHPRLKLAFIDAKEANDRGELDDFDLSPVAVDLLNALCEEACDV